MPETTKAGLPRKCMICQINSFIMRSTIAFRKAHNSLHICSSSCSHEEYSDPPTEGTESIMNDIPSSNVNSDQQFNDPSENYDHDNLYATQDMTSNNFEYWLSRMVKDQNWTNLGSTGNKKI